MQLLNPYFDLYQLMSGMPEHVQLSVRKKLIWAYSWAVPSLEAILAIAELSPIVELGAGSGYWAWLLRQAGAEVIALDQNAEAPPHWTAVQSGNAGQLSAYGKRNLFLCWPSYQEPMAAEALIASTGGWIAYVGEMNGRTADEEFHRLLKQNFALRREIEIPCWPGFRDRLYIFEKV
jgi:hypothetical protein